MAFVLSSLQRIRIQKNKKHTFFTILDKPVAPWGDGSSGTKVKPWISILRRLCDDWVKGQKDKDKAAGLIVEKVFHSGFKYDTDHGASKYTSGPMRDYAELLMWNNHLDSKPSLGQRVNCTDCGTIVCSLANVLGCELYSSIFKNSLGPGFGCHKIISIGIPGWDYPFSKYHGGTSGGFSYHEIAWKGGCGETDDIFDACLKTANDPDNHPAKDDIYPRNMTYKEYEPKLVIPADRAGVKPLPIAFIRRKVK